MVFLLLAVETFSSRQVFSRTSLRLRLRFLVYPTLSECTEHEPGSSVFDVILVKYSLSSRFFFLENEYFFFENFRLTNTLEIYQVYSEKVSGIFWGSFWSWNIFSRPMTLSYTYRYHRSSIDRLFLSIVDCWSSSAAFFFIFSSTSSF